MLSQGRLSSYFINFAAKRLTQVEISPRLKKGKSNQHEFNSTKELRNIFGSEKRYLATSFFYLADEEERTIRTSGLITFYDSREDDPIRSPEFRLYYQPNPAIDEANPNDLLLLCLLTDGKTLCLIAPQGSATESQLIWLFGLSEVKGQFIVSQLETGTKEDMGIGFAARLILEELGIEVPAQPDDEDELDLLLRNFNSTFPKTKEFSAYSRTRVPGLEELEDPDAILIACMEKEESLFKIFEKHIINPQIEKIFEDKEEIVEKFISLSKSVHGVRKSRAGYTLQNHLEYIFKRNNIIYSAQGYAEGRKKPDFLFPKIDNYKDPKFPTSDLTMLAAKRTFKERWSQVVSEAEKISPKHLLTLEPAVSKVKLEEIARHSIQLVIPEEVRNTYAQEEQNKILSLSEFMHIVKEKQAKHY